jgi:pimeloyl-ACP methyl ester carboxylesterase
MNIPPLLLIHGYPFDHSMWDHVAALLQDVTEVLAPDLRGFGDHPLPEPAPPPALGLMSDDLLKLLDEKNHARAVLAGMSMGGYVALSFADHYPERVAGLALVNSQTVADTDAIRDGRRTLIETVRREGPAAAAKAAIPKLFAPPNVGRPELVRFPLQGAEKAGVAGITWALEAMARRPDRTEVLRQLKVPTLILHGSEDQFIPVERARNLASTIPSAQYVELSGVGHALPLEAPEAVAGALRDLLGRVAASGKPA